MPMRLRPEKPRSGYDVGAMSAQIAPELIERLIRTCPLGALQGGTRQNRDVTSDHYRENRREHQERGERRHHESADYSQPELGQHLAPPARRPAPLAPSPRSWRRPSSVSAAAGRWRRSSPAQRGGLPAIGLPWGLPCVSTGPRECPRATELQLVSAEPGEPPSQEWGPTREPPGLVGRSRTQVWSHRTQAWCHRAAGLVSPDPGVVSPYPGIVSPDPGLVAPDPGVVSPELGGGNGGSPPFPN